MRAVWRVVAPAKEGMRDLLSGVRAPDGGHAKSRRKRALVVAVESVDEIETCLAELAGVCAEGGNA